jgi:AraC family transcriptional regulator
LAKIALESDTLPLTARRLSAGDGWTVSDFVCTAGPRSRSFEEQHSVTSIAVVLSGTFEYRSSTGRELMTPGSLLLGNAGDCFTCGHEHGTGDRCVSFSYSPEFFEGLATGGAASATRFTAHRLPPLRELSPLVAKTALLLGAAHKPGLEALAVQLATEAIRTAATRRANTSDVEASSIARVTRVVRLMENEPDLDHNLAGLAQVAGLSSFHFLRTFVRVTGSTPHQYLLRLSLRRAAVALKRQPTKILDLALECGFSDVSNFNRAFRAEFGVSPRSYRATP